MLNLFFKPHRSTLKAGTVEPQKVFALLKVIPDSETAQLRPPVAWVFVIDSSGSMRELAGDQSKLQGAIEAAHTLLNDERWLPDDQISIIQFSDQARVLLPLSPLGDGLAARQALQELHRYSGGTHGAKGLRCALNELHDSEGFSKRVLVLTDGQVFDENQCRELATAFGESNLPLIAVGIGDDYNENLLRDLAELSGGRPYHLQSLAEFESVLDIETTSSTREVVTDLRAEIQLVKGVRLDSVTRVYPSLAEIDTAAPLRLGNIAAGDYTVFTLEFSVAELARPASRARLAQLSLQGTVSTADEMRKETAIQELVMNFSHDEAETTRVDLEVLGYVQQKNADRLVQSAIQQASKNGSEAQSSLQSALEITRRVGNAPMTRMLQEALDELQQTGTLSRARRKTIGLGGRTRTVMTGAPSDSAPNPALPSEEDIRRLTGTGQGPTD
jgi:Ca-activated chloride channel family protein